MSEPPPSTSTAKIVLIILGIVLLVFLLICGGMIGFGWYAMNRFEEMIVAEMNSVGDDLLTEDALLEAISEDPTLQQQVGEIRKTRYDPSKTTEATDEDDWYFWYTVEGTDGIASVRALESEEDDRWFDSVELETPDGKLVPLELKPVPYYESTGERDVIRWVEQDPELQPLVGTVVAIRDDYERFESDEATYWYTVEGDAGTLPVLVTFDEKEGWFETVEHAEAEMPDGTRHEIFPGAGRRQAAPESP